MTEQEAIQLARNWIDVRIAVRRVLIARARQDNPVDAPTDGVVKYNSADVRKLYNYPSDLSVERLLCLIKEEGNTRWTRQT